ncbi:alpha-N-acetylglucosaminidase [Cytophagaceae bacterium DM2B3-1]|uniref:Alpha-N-acetylglucosaminidase n=1 Tax=Xanthocytophaga flava TaxID=3048013 RepID=A0ABT7CTC1_9BACT|nr:alpha-N-acetylglucosaminidase [Xanthocytophaga flavus]MDJ1497025.1 alpha-N-acetylglucosaminidase [Xanthocytophaga flavus]
MYFKRILLVGAIHLFCTSYVMAQLNVQASEAFVKRILPKESHYFQVESLAAEKGNDVFEIESKNGKIILRGSTGVAIGSALYYYLTEYAHCQITWNGTNLKLPASLPVVAEKIHKNTPYHYRYYLNYCTFNYSMSWWDWERWQKEIDWMALHGINMPLAITGEEYTWYEVYREMGFTDQDLQAFFSGPSYFSWFWMGNLDAWGGPLPVSWMQSHKELQQKIVARERELGMKPVLPAFTGHVPAAFRHRFPNAKLKATNWTNGFADTYILDSEDPMFAEIGKKFLQKQTALFGTDHLYSADTFNENEPPSDEPEFLSKLSARVYEGMRQADPQAVWVMQGWLFYSDRKFWKAPQIKALLDAVPNDHMIVLDLATEIEPVWKSTEAFYGKPWIWNMLNNFGGNVNLFGRIEGAAKGPAEALHDPKSGNLKGIGLTMEAIEQNPVLYELMMANTWRDQPIDLDKWLSDYIRNRYGITNEHTLAAWQILKTTVYNGKAIRDGAESIVTGRPTFDSTTVWTRTKLNYPPAELLPAWQHLVQAINTCKSSDGFQYDLVDVTRQVLANYALPLQKKWVQAYRQKNQADFQKYSKEFIELIDDMDKLLGTRKDFLLGKWIAEARSCGTTAEEKALYEQNARDLVTLWGDENSPLHEYSNRQWNGLLSDFYKPRWQQFFQRVNDGLVSGKDIDLAAFDKDIKKWEWKWVTEQKSFTDKPVGVSVDVTRQLYKKYWKKVQAAYAI